MSFLLDPIENGINSLLEPLTSSPTATSSADEVVPIETSTTDGKSKTTSTTKSTSTPSLTASATATTTTAESSTSSSARSRTTSTSESDTTTTTESTQSPSTTEDSSTTSLPTKTPTTLSTSILTSSSSTTVASVTPPAPTAAAQPTLTPSQSTTTDTPNTASSGSGFSTAGIVVASIFAAGLLVSIVWLTVRFCPPVRKRIDAWYERRREERTWRAALDGPAAEKGSLSSAGTSTTDPTRPFSFFALGRNPQLQGDVINADVETRESTQQPRQSYVPPASAEIYSPVSARPNGHGLGLGRVSLLRNTSLLRKAGFDTPPPQPPLSAVSSTTTTYHPQHRQSHPRASQATTLPIRAMKPSLSQIKRKPLPVDPPGIEDRSATDTQSRPAGPMSHARNLSSRDGSLPRLQIQIPGRPPGLAEIERVSQIGLAVTGSPAARRVR